MAMPSIAQHGPPSGGDADNAYPIRICPVAGHGRMKVLKSRKRNENLGRPYYRCRNTNCDKVIFWADGGPNRASRQPGQTPPSGFPAASQQQQGRFPASQTPQQHGSFQAGAQQPSPAQMSGRPPQNVPSDWNAFGSGGGTCNHGDTRGAGNAYNTPQGMEQPPSAVGYGRTPHGSRLDPGVARELFPPAALDQGAPPEGPHLGAVLTPELISTPLRPPPPSVPRPAPVTPHVNHAAGTYPIPRGGNTTTPQTMHAPSGMAAGPSPARALLETAPNGVHLYDRGPAVNTQPHNAGVDPPGARLPSAIARNSARRLEGAMLISSTVLTIPANVSQLEARIFQSPPTASGAGCIFLELEPLPQLGSPPPHFPQLVHGPDANGAIHQPPQHVGCRPLGPASQNSDGGSAVAATGGSQQGSGQGAGASQAGSGQGGAWSIRGGFTPSASGVASQGPRAGRAQASQATLGVFGAAQGPSLDGFNADAALQHSQEMRQRVPHSDEDTQPLEDAGPTHASQPLPAGRHEAESRASSQALQGNAFRHEAPPYGSSQAKGHETQPHASSQRMQGYAGGHEVQRRASSQGLHGYPTGHQGGQPRASSQPAQGYAVGHEAQPRAFSQPMQMNALGHEMQPRAWPQGPQGYDGGNDAQPHGLVSQGLQGYGNGQDAQPHGSRQGSQGYNNHNIITSFQRPRGDEMILPNDRQEAEPCASSQGLQGYAASREVQSHGSSQGLQGYAARPEIQSHGPSQGHQGYGIEPTQPGQDDVERPHKQQRLH